MRGRVKQSRQRKGNDASHIYMKREVKGSEMREIVEATITTAELAVK